MTMTEGLYVMLAILTAGSGAVIWIVAIMTMPIKKAIEHNEAKLREVIEGNTKVIERVMCLVDDHEARLDEHHDRISKIETVHEMRRCTDIDI